ncbi:hypothetical protein [Mesorhizobium sp. 8]|uniref:hypothetical protein n=1 Tax=Mesorhizobium sp. 8 TaxID=2584466 RepID=UPI001123C5E0|nr:hypothetical protein [Mesorhizobium sp. 8]QDC02310.1 hypothetical protein FGU64_18755 [Mesorhizobium sp. 8]
MAMTNAQKVRAHRERKKAQQKVKTKQAEHLAVFEHPREPFFEWYNGGSDFQMCLDIAGIEAPEIEDDSDPKSATGEIEAIFTDNPEDSPYYNAKGSLARAEIMVGALISATVELASLVNRYKRKQITDRIRQIETSDLSDPDARKQALTNVVRLNKMLEQLDKQVRWTFPQWKASGE